MRRNQNPSKEEIIEYYINQLHTVNECCSFFGIGKTKFYTCLRCYNITRSKEDQSQVYARAQNSETLKDKIKQTKDTNNSNQRFVNFISEKVFRIKDQEYTVDWFIEEYCNKNTSLTDMCNILQVSTTIIYQICQHYDIAKTNAQRYDNIKKTVVEKYGVVSTLQLDEVKEKSQQTCLGRYGVQNPMQSSVFVEKQKNTMQSKYGVDNYSKTKEYSDKAAAASIKKYGAPHHSQKDMRHLDVWLNRKQFNAYLDSLDKKPTPYDLMCYFNLSDRTVVYNKICDWHLGDKIQMNPPRSHYEDEIAEILQSMGVINIVRNDRTLLDGQEIDIYLPDYKLGIEFNGDYWHSDIYYTDHNGRSTHHQEKSLLAESKGVFLFHIFEYEWNNPAVKENILNRLHTLLQKNDTKIPARKCSIVELTKRQKKEFLNTNHIQGNDHSAKQYGLLYNKEIVACMTFVSPKNGKYTWELSRFCNKHGCTIQGGASKLFSFFVSDLDIDNTISSYNDITKTKGNLYKVLGFTCTSVNQPNYVWMNFKTGDIRTRYQEQAGGEVTRMHDQGYHRICDCGTKTWVYTKK